MKNGHKESKKRRWDIVGIGSPLLDVVVEIDDEALLRMNIRKGSANLISAEESGNIFKEFAHLKRELSSGGSAANTIAGAAALGNRTAFLGVVGDDEYGRVYEETIGREGVASHLSRHASDATGHAIILITPDGERTMVTHLGAALHFAMEHVKGDEIKAATILHIEAYQLELPGAYLALSHAIMIAKESGTLVSIDLSDVGLIRRNKQLFQRIVREHIDIVFANEEEASEFTGKADPTEALSEIAESCTIAVVKLGAKGSLIKKGKDVYRIEPHPVEMVNTNGAGDMYAAGILHGLVNGLGLQESGAIASHLSALVVASSGARLDKKHHSSIHKYKKV
jgi:sugar/nucleoside kinase (ribokinase family)